VTCVTVRLSLYFVLDVKIYTLDREDRVSWGCIAVRRAEIVGKMIQEQGERDSKRTIEGGDQ
jgi:hypothetical protein